MITFSVRIFTHSFYCTLPVRRCRYLTVRAAQPYKMAKVDLAKVGKNLLKSSEGGEVSSNTEVALPFSWSCIFGRFCV